jgi:hypothetical protein
MRVQIKQIFTVLTNNKSMSMHAGLKRYGGDLPRVPCTERARARRRTSRVLELILEAMAQF